MTDARIAGLNALLDAYPRTPLTAGTLDLYRSMLSDIPDQVLLAGIAECIATRTWLPTVAEIRAACAKMAPAEDSIPTAAEAWEEIRSQLGDALRPPALSTSIAETALRQTNTWTSLNLMPLEELKWERQRFERIYEDLRDRALEESRRCPQAVAMLAGDRPARITGPSVEAP